MRMTEWGQTMTHFPHWIQISRSHTGISWARLRFSHFVVPDGYVPSIGSLLTGRSSPLPAIIGPSTSRTNTGASAGTGERRRSIGSGVRRDEPLFDAFSA